MDVEAIAAGLSKTLDTGARCEPVSDEVPGFTIDDAYAVLAAIRRRRVELGWRRVGRKIGFTNPALWEGFGTDRACWADAWDRTTVFATDGAATTKLDGLAQPCIEPEVVFSLRGPVPPTVDPVEALTAVEWMAPAVEVVRCPYPGWRFDIADCVAAAGFHGGLVVGTRVPIDDANREAVGAALASFEATVSRDGEPVATGVGANVLGSPALALAHIARVLSEQPGAPQLAAGELVTTGTITTAHPVRAGERWHVDHGELGLEPLTLTLA